MKSLMRFLIIVVVIGLALYYGGNAYLRRTFNTDIDVGDLVMVKDTVQDFIRSQSPEEAKEALSRHAKTVQLAIEKGLVTARQIDEAQLKLEEMIRDKTPFDKMSLADKYLKGKVSASDYAQVQSILANGDISLNEWYALLKIIKKAN
ncbi:MAG: hypothetical protein ACM3ZQ_07585 [Bacillota bacterium]